MKSSRPEIPTHLLDAIPLQAFTQVEAAAQELDVTGYVGDQLVTLKAEQLLKGARPKNTIPRPLDAIRRNLAWCDGLIYNVLETEMGDKIVQ